MGSTNPPQDKQIIIFSAIMAVDMSAIKSYKNSKKLLSEQPW
jgi:hypothetical protein